MWQRERRTVLLLEPGALETETARNWMCFNEVYREVFGVLTIHIYNDEKLSGVVL
jgi:hypothetical protein